MENEHAASVSAAGAPGTSMHDARTSVTDGAATATSAPAISTPKVFGSKQTMCRGWHTEPNHRHSEWEFTLVVHGRVRSVVAGEERIIGGGTLVLLPSGIRHDWAVESEEAVFWVLCVEEPSITDGIEKDAATLVEEKGPWHGFVGQELDKVVGELEQIRYEMLTRSDGWTRMVALLIERLLIWCRRLRRDEPDDSLPASLRKALVDLDGGELACLRVDKLAENLHVSQGHLRRVFGRLYGVSPKEYIDRTRLNRAKMLLLQTDLSVGEIAERTGFGDIQHFSAFFRKCEGIAPTRWRRR